MTPYNIKELTWEKWKRFYLNEPLLRKSKGTLNSIRYAMNIFGIPSSMYYFGEMIKSGYGVDFESAIRNNTREYYITKNLYGLNLSNEKSLYYLSSDISLLEKPTYKTNNAINSIIIYFSINWKNLFESNLENDSFDIFIKSDSISTKVNEDCKFSILKSNDEYYWKLVNTVEQQNFTIKKYTYIQKIDILNLSNGLYCLNINLSESSSTYDWMDWKLSHISENNNIIYDWEGDSGNEYDINLRYQLWNNANNTIGMMFGSQYTNENIYNLYAIKMFWTKPSEQDLLSHAKNPKQYYTSNYSDNMCLYIDLDNPRNMALESPHPKPINITKSKYPLQFVTFEWGTLSGDELFNGWNYQAFWPYNFTSIETKVALYSYSSMSLIGDKTRIIPRDTTNLLLTKDSKLQYEYNIEKDNYMSNIYMLFSNARNIDIIISERYDSNVIKSSMIKPQDFYSSSYSTLIQARNEFFTTWNIRSLIPNWSLISNAIDPDIWNVVKKLSPARSEIIGGYYIAPHMFERSKLDQKLPEVTLQDSNENQINFENFQQIQFSLNSSQLAIVDQNIETNSVLLENYFMQINPNTNEIDSSVSNNYNTEYKIFGSDYSSTIEINNFANYNVQRYEPVLYFNSSATSAKKLKDYPKEIINSKKQLYDKPFNPYSGCTLSSANSINNQPPVQVKRIKVAPVIKVDKKIGGTAGENKTIDIVRQGGTISVDEQQSIEEAKIDIRMPITGIPKFVSSDENKDENNEKKITSYL